MTSSVHIDRAVRCMLAGGVIAYPTEAVYGLGCLPENARAVERLLELKRRSWRMGLLLIAAELAQLEPLVELPAGAIRAEILASWPGPVTWVLPARPRVPAWITGGRKTVGVRVTAHVVAQSLCLRAGQALVSTSANRHRRRPHTSALRLRRDLGRDVDYVVPGGLGQSPRPTTIRDGVTGRVLRPG